MELSDIAKVEATRLSTLSPKEIVKEYNDFEKLPINNYINIDKIAIINWNPLTRSNSSMCIKYRLFTELNPERYPEGSDPNLDYMPDEEVSPVIIIDTDGKKYNTDYLFWFPLIDIHDDILLKQKNINYRVFPHKVLIDQNINENGNVTNTWISKLLQLVGHDIIQMLGGQK